MCLSLSAIATACRRTLCRKYQALTALNKDFISAAVTYGRTIISEYFLKEEAKSVCPSLVGGIAGGRKFLLRGILFKLADGSRGPYDGSDEAAGKALNNDLKGAVHLVKCSIPGLFCSLQALIDYKGFRMHAQAQLPLCSRATLRCGSCDAGATVVDGDGALRHKLRLVAAQLNLKAHRGRGGAELQLGCDVEGHRGTDGNLYVIDAARVFPPESP
ncbi:CLU domain-containing protein, partial [Tribonema minus]